MIQRQDPLFHFLATPSNAMNTQMNHSDMTDHWLIYSLRPLGHFISVPARTVGIWLLNLRIELPAVSEVVHGLEGEGGLVPGEVQWKVHYGGQTGRCREGQRCLYTIIFLYMFCLTWLIFLPCTRKQKSFHMSRRVSFVNPSASYSTTPLE